MRSEHEHSAETRRDEQDHRGEHRQPPRRHRRLRTSRQPLAEPAPADGQDVDGDVGERVQQQHQRRPRPARPLFVERQERVRRHSWFTSYSPCGASTNFTARRAGGTRPRTAPRAPGSRGRCARPVQRAARGESDEGASGDERGDGGRRPSPESQPRGTIATASARQAGGQAELGPDRSRRSGRRAVGRAEPAAGVVDAIAGRCSAARAAVFLERRVPTLAAAGPVSRLCNGPTVSHIRLRAVIELPVRRSRPAGHPVAVPPAALGRPPAEGDARGRRRARDVLDGRAGAHAVRARPRGAGGARGGGRLGARSRGRACCSRSAACRPSPG